MEVNNGLEHHQGHLFNKHGGRTKPRLPDSDLCTWDPRPPKANGHIVRLRPALRVLLILPLILTWLRPPGLSVTPSQASRCHAPAFLTDAQCPLKGKTTHAGGHLSPGFPEPTWEADTRGKWAPGSRAGGPGGVLRSEPPGPGLLAPSCTHGVASWDPP